MRRIFRRHIRKKLGPDIPPILQEANFAFDKGEYGRAGELFERLAETADARGGPRAPLFYLKAGQARVLAGQTSLGAPSLKRGLALLAQREQFSRLQNAGAHAIAALRERGMNNEANEIETWLQSVLAYGAFSSEQPAKRSILPTHCLSCGAVLRPDEVEWLDEVTAECGYCGTPARK
jgi:hypothetical protein